MTPLNDVERAFGVNRPGFGPERYEGDTRPDFAAGNTLAQQHGAWSERKFSPLAAELLADVIAQAEDDPDLSHLRSAAFRPALRAWARIEARIELLATFIEERTTEDTPGDIDEDGEIRPAAALLARLEVQAVKQRAALALDPTSMARLRRDAGAARNHFDMARLMAGLDNPDDGDDDDAEA